MRTKGERKRQSLLRPMPWLQKRPARPTAACAVSTKKCISFFITILEILDGHSLLDSSTDCKSGHTPNFFTGNKRKKKKKIFVQENDRKDEHTIRPFRPVGGKHAIGLCPMGRP